MDRGSAGIRTLAAASLAAASLLAFAAAAFGAAGEPDPSFGNNGFTILDEPVFNNESLNDVVVQPDGKILGAGAQGNSSGFLLARFNADGTPDQTFGEGGIRVEPDTGKPGDPRAINGIVQRSDGKIVAVGFGVGEKADVFEFARFRPDGTLDPEFGTGGLAPVPVEPAGNAFAVAQAPDGSVVAAGDNGPGNRAVVVRVTENGLPDAGFNGTGIQFVDVPESLSEFAGSVRVLASGATLIGGFAENGAFLAELDKAGKPVNTFGENGIAVHDLGTNGESFGGFEDLRVLPDGRILAAGTTEAKMNDFELVVARFTPSGALDPSFADGGVFRLNPTPLEDEGFAMQVLPDGRILVAGERENSEVGGNGDTWLVRLTPEGRLDPSFGEGGEGAGALPGRDAAFGLAVQPDGRAVIAGRAVEESGKLLVGRFTADTGATGTPEARAPRCAGRPATIVGTKAADRLRGTRRADVIVTLGGNDRVKAAAGNDLVCAGAGKDVVKGGKGHDLLFGGPGPDRLFGGPARDRCNGGAGRRDRSSGCERLRKLP